VGEDRASDSRVDRGGVRRWLNAERALDPLSLVRIGRVVRVTLRRSNVSVAHPRLQGAHRDAGGGHRRAEGVPQLVEGQGRVEASGVERLAIAAKELRLGE
jgi:hypothetical protein